MEFCVPSHDLDSTKGTPSASADNSGTDSGGDPVQDPSSLLPSERQGAESMPDIAAATPNGEPPLMQGIPQDSPQATANPYPSGQGMPHPATSLKAKLVSLYSAPPSFIPEHDLPAPQPPLVAPAVRGWAKQLGVDLRCIAGSGPAGRILREDVAAAAEAMQQASPTTTQESQSLGNSAHAMDAGILPLKEGKADITVEARVVPLKGYRKAMATSMTSSLAIPHFHLCDEVDMGPLLAIRDGLRCEGALAQSKLTFLPFLLKALSLALHEHPDMNSTLAACNPESISQSPADPWDGPALVHHPHHNVGVAMATPTGLVVPVVKRVNDLSIAEVAAEVSRLQSHASQGRVPTADLQGATISVSNIGTLGGTYATPLIRPPEVAIVALGKIRMLPRFSDDGAVEARPMMNVSWAADHRVIDGAMLAKFNSCWLGYLKSPERMLLHLR